VPKIHILVVDDSVAFRRLLSEELGRDPALEVVTAANGRIAFTKAALTNPDLVVLDVEMAEMDGLETLRDLRKTYPRLPIIVFSARTERGAAVTLDALSLGATDYVTKPSDAAPDAMLRVIRERLVPKIKGLCAPPAGETKASPPRVPASLRGPVPTGTVRAVVIATSTGGPDALAEVFARLPAGFPVPILIVQHMPPMFTRMLAERLTAASPIHVEEGAAGTLIEPGRGWIAPGDYHMAVVRDGVQHRLVLHKDPLENQCRPAADVLLRSAAQAYGADVLAVILTGLGQDGLRGAGAIREAGGQVIAQDLQTSVAEGMPGSVASAGLADKVLPLSRIADEIIERVRAGRR
jgi:two-component system, chemotaxis family, protein-glutamate methylesterase/glutaminase